MKYNMEIGKDNLKFRLRPSDVATMDRAIDIMREIAEATTTHHPDFGEGVTYYNDGWTATHHDICKALEAMIVFAVEDEILVR